MDLRFGNRKSLSQGRYTLNVLGFRVFSRFNLQFLKVLWQAALFV